MFTVHVNINLISTKKKFIKHNFLRLTSHAICLEFDWVRARSFKSNKGHHLWRLSRLVPERLLPRPSPSMQFGYVSQTNSQETHTDHVTRNAGYWGLGTRQERKLNLQIQPFLLAARRLGLRLSYKMFLAARSEERRSYTRASEKGVLNVKKLFLVSFGVVLRALLSVCTIFFK